MKKISYLVICIIIVIGAVVAGVKGFKFDMQYEARNKITLSNKTGIEISEMKQIAKEVLGDKRFKVQEVELFGNTVSIIANEITEDEKTKIVEKFNEKYGTDVSIDSVTITNIPHTRIRDIIKPYILPIAITFIIILVYFMIRYSKLGITKVCIETIAKTVLMELLAFSIIAIARIPFGTIVPPIILGVYTITVTIISSNFENKRVALELEEEKK